MSWAARFELRQYLKGSLWVVPLVGGAVSPLHAAVVSRPAAEGGARHTRGHLRLRAVASDRGRLRARHRRHPGRRRCGGQSGVAAHLPRPLHPSSTPGRGGRARPTGGPGRSRGLDRADSRPRPRPRRTRRALRGCDEKTRLVIPGRSWEDYLQLAVTEIREYGATFTQVCRRLRALLEALLRAAPAERHPAVEQELARLAATVDTVFLDPDSRALAQPDPLAVTGMVFPV